MAEELSTCRICLDTGDAGSLVAPCRCTGTQQFVHKHCLHHWVSTYTLQPSFSPYHQLNTYVCPVCKGFFRHKAERHPRLLSLSWMLAVLGLFICSLVSEIALILVTIGLFTALTRFDLSIRLIWVKNLPRLELIQTLQPGTLLQATSKLDYGVFQGTRLLVVTNSITKGVFALIINRPKMIMGEKVHLGVSDIQGPESPQSIHILHATKEIGGKEVVPGLYYGGCYLSLLAYPHISRSTYYGEATWSALELENEVSAGYWSKQGLVTVDTVLS